MRTALPVLNITASPENPLSCTYPGRAHRIAVDLTMRKGELTVYNGYGPSLLFHLSEGSARMPYGRQTSQPLYTTSELYRHAQLIFNRQPQRKVIVKLGVSCYALAPA